MAKREYTMNLRCAEPSCRETSFSVSTTRRDQAEAYAYYREHPWRCTRHTRPDEVLSAADPARESVLEVRERPNLGLRWMLLEDEKSGGNGFITGPGFKAFAKDFPPGTRLVVTARIELPTEPPASR